MAAPPPSLFALFRNPDTPSPPKIPLLVLWWPWSPPFRLFSDEEEALRIMALDSAALVTSRSRGEFFTRQVAAMAEAASQNLS